MTELVVKDPIVNLNDLKLHLYAEFETWDEFVAAVDEFQKKTFIKLTIITSKKLKTAEASRKSKGNPKILLPETSDDEDENKMKGKKKKNRSRFEYQYLKLTCKHYGRYVSTSKGIRPNQKTAKLECPTFLYASYDHYKDKFIIKQMNISCNHELKDEDVALPKLLQKTISHETDSSFLNPAVKEKKKYVKIQNRNVIKIPLESPTLGALIVNVNKRIKCTHEINSSCQAASLTNDDLMSIHSLFSDKKRKEQDEMIYEWVSLNEFEINNSSITKQLKQNNRDDGDDKLLIQFKLPTLDGTLINVCFKAFTSILNITNSRVNEVISNQYAKMTKQNNGTTTTTTNSSSTKNREIETSIATILTSFNNTNNEHSNEQVLEILDGENQQLMIIDTVDVPTTENTIEDPFNQTTTTTTAQTIERTTQDDEILTTSTIVPVEINEKRFELSSIAWWQQIGKDEESIDTSIKEQYGKLDIKRCILILKLSFTDNDFQTEIYAQPVNVNEHPLILEISKKYKTVEDVQTILDEFNSLALCRGISDPQLKNYANEIKSNSNSTFTYCYYSDSVRSKCCELLYDESWSFGMCRFCYSILDNVN